MDFADYNEQQKEAIELAVQWYRNFRAGKTQKQVFFISGFAGTGKTSVAQTIAELCVGTQKHRIAYVAPTGKAASRLRQKGCANARTIHSFAYRLLGEDEEKNPIFREKGMLDESPLIVVADEVSMIGERDDRALRSHGLPILALGDLGQVPPVKAVAAYTESHVDYQLTKIERNAGKIVEASMLVRQGRSLPEREYDDIKIRMAKPPLTDLLNHVGEDAQILCALNNTRQGTNAKIRSALGFNAKIPEVGEKVICTFNQHDFGFMNGEQLIVESYRKPTYSEIDGEWPEEMLIVSGKSLSTGRTKHMAFNPLCFSDDEEVRKDAYKSQGGFDYGYAITVHKAQGSEFEKVLIIEDSFNRDFSRMMYTAITRAISHLTIYRG